MSDFEVGTEFAGYRLGEVIGRGGMGVVYRAIDVSLQRPVAVKLIADELSADPALRDRFKREARLMAAIDHPNVIPVYAAGEADGHLYLVMRWVDGTDLHRLLSSRGRLPVDEALPIVEQVGKALDAAHQRGLVHRDIKPANVLLDKNHVYLTDFGITRLVDDRTRTTDTGKWVGTLDYMAPEHLRGEAVDGLSDIYSLTCLLYTCLTGTPPFRRDAPAATITAHLHDPAPKPSRVAEVPPQLDAVIARGLAKRPKDRYPTAAALIAAARSAADPDQKRFGRRAVRRRGEAVSAVEPPSASAADESATRIVPPTSFGSPAPAVPVRDAAAAAPKVLATERPAAPEDPAPTSATVVAEDSKTRIAKTQVAQTAVMGTSPPPRLQTSQPPRWRRAAALTALLALGIALVVVPLLALTGGANTTDGPLTAGEITQTVQRFASAYSDRNAAALARLFTADVSRVSTSDTQNGRAAVVREYQQQFNTKPIPVRYTLSGLQVTSGWAGRARGIYKLTLSGGGTESGTVVFGLTRDGTAARIGLVETG